VTTLFGRNPVVMAILGAALIVAGLAAHARILPFIGGFLLIAGGVRAVLRLLKGSPIGGKGDGWSLR
jgi:hypothetical protein